jgi:hypothetical protein
MSSTSDGSHPNKNNEDSAPVFKPLPRLLGDMQSHFVNRCRRLFEQSLAEAESNLARTSDSGDVLIAELRKHRDVMLQKFTNTLAANFHLLVLSAPESAAMSAHLASSDAGVEDTLQLEATLNKSAAALRSIHHKTLNDVARRLDHLLLQVEVDESNNPIEPMLVAQSFIRAVSIPGGLPIKLREVLFSQFDSQVLEKLAPSFDDINKILTNARILPETIEASERILDEPGTPAAKSDPPVRNLISAPDLVASDLRLTTENASPAAKDTLVPEIRSSSVLALGALKHTVSVLDQDDPLKPVKAPSKALPRQPLSPEPDVDLPTRANLARDSATGICTALFDEIRGDAEVPPTVKKELAKLQLVYTLYALNRAPDFLLKPEHPARILIELLWDMGRSLRTTAAVESHPRFRAIVEVIDELRERKSPSEQDFFQVYCMLLALQ